MKGYGRVSIDVSLGKTFLAGTLSILAFLLLIGCVTLTLKVREKEKFKPSKKVLKLSAQRDKLEKALKTLEEDFKNGKISKATYDKLRGELLSKLEKLEKEIELSLIHI